MTDDKLLQQFFSDAARQQIADDGFTERVLQALPKADNAMTPASVPHAAPRIAGRFTFVWNTLCIAAFLVFFVYVRGWQLLADHFAQLLHSVSSLHITFNPILLAVILFTLLFVGVAEVVSSRA